MKFISFVFCLCFTLVSAQSSASSDFQINNNTRLSDLKGQVVYIDFWASWCKPCRASFPWMNQMQAKYSKQGLKVIAINLDETKRNADLFLNKVPAKFTLVFDPEGKIASQYDLVGMPSSYLIDKQGKLRVSHQGFFAAKQTDYENEIQQLLAE